MSYCLQVRFRNHAFPFLSQNVFIRNKAILEDKLTPAQLRRVVDDHRIREKLRRT